MSEKDPNVYKENRATRALVEWVDRHPIKAGMALAVGILAPIVAEALGPGTGGMVVGAEAILSSPVWAPILQEALTPPTHHDNHPGSAYSHERRVMAEDRRRDPNP